MPTANARLLDHQHGAVNNRCIHPDCTAAFAAWTKRYKLDQHRGLARTVDGDAVRLHLAALEGAGWSRRSIAAAAGISATAVCRIANGQPTVRRAFAQAVLAVDPAAGPPRKASNGTAQPFVPRVGTVRRIQALLALGWPHTELIARCGVRTTTLLSQQGRWVTRASHDAVAAVYRDLAATPGPSAITRRRAAALGYHSPAAWDDIDLDAEPDTDEHAAPDHDVDEAVVLRILDGHVVPATTAERREVVARWTTTGRSINDLARLTGWKPERYADQDDVA